MLSMQRSWFYWSNIYLIHGVQLNTVSSSSDAYRSAHFISASMDYRNSIKRISRYCACVLLRWSFLSPIVYIHSFIYSFIHLFIHSLIHSFIHSFSILFLPTLPLPLPLPLPLLVSLIPASLSPSPSPSPPPLSMLTFNFKSSIFLIAGFEIQNVST